MGNRYAGIFTNKEIIIAKNIISAYRRRWKSLQSEDPDDLLQECLIYWLELRPRYDKSQNTSLHAFMAGIIKNKLRDLAKNAQRDKRKTLYHSTSLDAPILGDPENGTVMDTITNADNPFPQTSLSIDLSYVINKLTPDQQKLVSLIKNGFTINEASKHFSKHRSCVYNDARKIREVFENEGFLDYLK